MITLVDRWHNSHAINPRHVTTVKAPAEPNGDHRSLLYVSFHHSSMVTLEFDTPELRDAAYLQLMNATGA